MSKILSLAMLASIAISAVSAVDITFKRYSQAGCHQEKQHIAADTHLHDPHCKSFDEDEPAFYSFIISPEDDLDDLYNKYCYAVVFDGEDCTGHAFTFGDMGNYLNRCADSPIPGRSVRIVCEDASTTITGALPTSTSTHTPATKKAGSTTTLTVSDDDFYCCGPCERFF